MPEYEITAQEHSANQVHWRGTAANEQAAMRQLEKLLAQAHGGEDMSGSGLHIFPLRGQLERIKTREIAYKPDPPPAPRRRPGPLSSTDLHPLYLLHTAWRALSQEERREFLTEMLTPNDRRFVALGLDEE